MSQTLHTFPRSIFFPAPALSLYSTGRGAFQYASGTEHKHDKDWDNRQSDSDIHSSIIILIYSLHLLHQNGQCEFVLGEQKNGRLHKGVPGFHKGENGLGCHSRHYDWKNDR